MSEVQNAESTTTATPETKVTPEAQVQPTPTETKTDSPAAENKQAAPAENKDAKDSKGSADKSQDPAEKPEEKTKAPEKYELKLGKNSPLQPADIAKIEADAKAQGLSNEEAQKIVEAKEGSHAEWNVRQLEAMKTLQASWVKEIEADKEIGGKAFKENIEIAHRGLNKFADDAFKKVLSESGLGNNPHLIRTFYRIGKMMENDKAVLDGKAGAPAKKASKESKLYPKMFQTQE